MKRNFILELLLDFGAGPSQGTKPTASCINFGCGVHTAWILIRHAQQDFVASQLIRNATMDQGINNMVGWQLNLYLVIKSQTECQKLHEVDKAKKFD